jgi:required for meiotic nuclear division protein 1
MISSQPTSPQQLTTTAAVAEAVPACAWLLGERLDTRALERHPPPNPGPLGPRSPSPGSPSPGSLNMGPLAFDLDGGGVAVLFRYGAVVVFGAEPAAADKFVASLAPVVEGAFAVPEREELRLLIRPDSDQHVDPAGNIVLRDKSTERFQLVADILAKSLVLAHYETRIADIFDRIEPLAATLRESGRPGATGKVLLRQIGDVLLMQQQMVGRVGTSETPELLWEHPELERLYLRLSDEYELRDRDRALDRKLDIVSRTVETLLSLVQTRSSMRVEWYIVLLIVAELVLSTLPLLLRR